jgi:hypothetical protein
MCVFAVKIISILESKGQLSQQDLKQCVRSALSMDTSSNLNSHKTSFNYLCNMRNNNGHSGNYSKQRRRLNSLQREERAEGTIANDISGEAQSVPTSTF